MLRLLQANYQAGTVNFLLVLTANWQYQQARIGYIQARAQRLQDTVALFVALGGGWRKAVEGTTDTSSARGGTRLNS
jgi:outer membrane protein TolC